MWLLYISCAWVAGMFLGSRISLSPFLLSFGLLPFLLIPVFFKNKKTLIVLGLCLFALTGGVLRFPSSLPQEDEHSLCFYNDSAGVEVQGMVAEGPDVRSQYCLLRLAASEVSVDSREQEVTGTVLIRVPRYSDYRYGDVLRVEGELETPPQFEDFDYQRYLVTQGIYSVIYYPEIEVLDRNMGSHFLQWLYSLREGLSLSLARTLPEPQASLAQGILLGIKSNIPRDVQQAFSRTGTAHLLAISGLHIGIVVAMFLGFAVLVLGRQRSLYIWLTLVAIWFYVLLSGMHPPVIRGAIMGSLFLLAEFLGRQRSAITALSFAAAVMVGLQPQVLWSTSFQLSFLAMAGIIFFYPHFHGWGRRKIAAFLGDKGTAIAVSNVVVDTFAVSLAAVLAVWPLIACNFKVISLVGLPATFLAMPALPAIIVTSALVAFTGFFAPVVAQFLGWLAWIFLSYLLLVVRGFDALPCSSFPVGDIPIWLVWGYYLVLAAIAIAIGRREQMASSFPGLTRGVGR